MAVGVVVIDHDKEMFVELCDSEEQMGRMTLKELKEKIRDKFRPKYPDYGVRIYKLHFKEKLLEDDSALLSDLGIQHMSTINLSASISFFKTLKCRLPFCPIRLFEEKDDDKKRNSLELKIDFEQQFEISDQQPGN